MIYISVLMKSRAFSLGQLYAACVICCNAINGNYSSQNPLTHSMFMLKILSFFKTIGSNLSIIFKVKLN